MPGFSKLPFIFYLFFQTIPHINSETNPPYPIINVVSKYLRQFLATIFGVAIIIIIIIIINELFQFGL